MHARFRYRPCWAQDIYRYPCLFLAVEDNVDSFTSQNGSFAHSADTGRQQALVQGPRPHHTERLQERRREVHILQHLGEGHGREDPHRLGALHGEREEPVQDGDQHALRPLHEGRQRPEAAGASPEEQREDTLRRQHAAHTCPPPEGAGRSWRPRPRPARSSR